MPSKVIRAFTYDVSSQALTIWFQSGRCYRYVDVPERAFLSMKAAFSKGVYFNRHIRDRYRSIEISTVGGEPPPHG